MQHGVDWHSYPWRITDATTRRVGESRVFIQEVVISLTSDSCALRSLLRHGCGRGELPTTPSPHTDQVTGATCRQDPAQSSWRDPPMSGRPPNPHTTMSDSYIISTFYLSFDQCFYLNIKLK